MKTMMPIFLSLAIVTSSCVDHSIDSKVCYQGVVIGKIRSWGGGVAVSMQDTTFSSHQWKGFENVVEALNIPDSLHQPGKQIYFLARHANLNEKTFAMSTDGDESDKPIIFVLRASSARCPATND